MACAPEKSLIEGKWELSYAQYYYNTTGPTRPHSYTFKNHGRFEFSSNGDEDLGSYQFTNDSLWTSYDGEDHYHFKIWILNDTHLYLK